MYKMSEFAEMLGMTEPEARTYVTDPELQVLLNYGTTHSAETVVGVQRDVARRILAHTDARRPATTM